MAKRVYISKNASEVVELAAKIRSNGFELISHSFLQYTQVDFNQVDDFDVIFFGSPRAVFFFKSQMDIPSNVEIACVGRKTGEVIKAIQRDVAFEGSGSIHEIVSEFKNWCGSKRVLFPISNRSLKTTSALFNEDQKEELVVYETSIISRETPECEYYVFTSPSNVQGFMESNKAPLNSKIIAWGESTKSALEEFNQEVFHTLDESSIDELASFLLS